MHGKIAATAAFFAAAILSTSFFAGCGDAAGGAVPAKTAKLIMRVESASAKTILPSFAAPASYKLTVSAGPTAIGPLTSETGTFSLELLYGTYNFLVEGFDGAGATGQVTCSGSLNGRAVDADGTITVGAAPAYAAGTGAAKVTLFWPKTVSVTKAEFACVQADTDPAGGDWSEFPVAGHRATFSRTSVASGNYMLHYRLWKGAERLVSETRSLQIAGNLESKALLGLASRYFGTSAMLSAKFETAAYLSANGKIWTWGSDTQGQRGVAATGTVNPFPSELPGLDWSQVNYGPSLSAGIKTNGELWTWGSQPLGRAGLYYTPGKVGADSDWLQAVVGNDHLLALKSDGSLWACGGNSGGQLGLGDTGDRSDLNRVGADSDWIEVGAGEQFSIALKADGSLWSWGQDAYGRLGNGAGSTANILVPTRIGTDADWAAAFAGSFSAFGLKADGSLYGWGLNNSYQLGLGNNVQKDEPNKIGADVDWALVAQGTRNTVAVKKDGSLWTWGECAYGALGNAQAAAYSTTPERLGIENDWVDAAAGHFYAIARKANGKIYVWGMNDKGQLGDGSYGETANKLVPSLNSLESFTLSFNLKGAPGEVPATRTLRYNETTTAPTAPVWTNQVFAGWYSDTACTLAWDFATSRVTAATTLFAKWQLQSFNSGVSVLLVSPAEESISLGPDQSLSRSGSLTLTVAQDFSVYRWYIDGERIAGATAKTLTLPMIGYAVGRHNLTAMVVKDGRWYSKNLYFALSD